LKKGGLSIVGHGLPDHDQQHSNHLSPTVKPEAPSAMYAPDDGQEAPKTC